MQVIGLDWLCQLAGSSKTAPRILIFSIVMGARPSFQLKFIAVYVLQFFSLISDSLCSVYDTQSAGINMQLPQSATISRRLTLDFSLNVFNVKDKPASIPSFFEYCQEVPNVYVPSYTLLGIAVQIRLFGYHTCKTELQNA